jgi:EAL domain-containing protein (putative c-di-GMP-specific phosphodiesterase class I)
MQPEWITMTARDLRLALERGKFRLNYQRLVQRETGRLAGWDALVRWEHPVRGLISPVAFIPSAMASVGMFSKNQLACARYHWWGYSPASTG